MTTIFGYSSATSVVQGGSLDFCVSSDPASTLQIAVSRVGHETTPVKVDTAPATPQPIPSDAYENGCNWPVFYTLAIDPSWESGMYRMDLKDDTSTTPTTIIFIVKSSTPGTTSPILFQSACTTYLAYDSWLKSFYLSDSPWRSFKLSFDRPSGAPDEMLIWYSTWEIRFINWLEANNIVVEYCTSVDLHADPTLLSNYQLMLSVGHDEYWSKEMRDHLESFIGAGGNAAFFSGNTCWWQHRFENNNRQMVCYKDAVEDPLTATDSSRVTVEWHGAPVYRPENYMTGVSYRYGAGAFFPDCGVNRVDYAYKVRFAKHWVFEGTGLADNDLFGVNESILGYETDAANFVEINGVPLATGQDGTPPTFVILATADLRAWKPCGKGGFATMGIYRRNGTVFTAATTDWTSGLGIATSQTQQITKNVLTKLSARYSYAQWEIIGPAKSGTIIAATEQGLFGVISSAGLSFRRAIASLGGPFRNLGDLFTYMGDVIRALFGFTIYQLYWRIPTGQNVNWQGIITKRSAPAITAMAGADNLNSNLGSTIYAVDKDKTLWKLNLTANRNQVNPFITGRPNLTAHWVSVGPIFGAASSLVPIALAATDSTLYCVAQDSKTQTRSLLHRTASDPSATWTTLCPADDVIAMTALSGGVFAVTQTNRLLYLDIIGAQWEDIGEATNIVSLAALDGKLFAVTNDKLLKWRDAARS